MNGVPVVLTFESVNKNMLMKVYLSSIVHYIKLSLKNYHLLGLLQEQEDPENKNKNILKIQFCFVDWSVKLQGHQFLRQPIINDNNDDDNENDDAYDDAYANDDDDDDDNVNCSSIEECDDNQ